MPSLRLRLGMAMKNYGPRLRYSGPGFEHSVGVPGDDPEASNRILSLESADFELPHPNIRSNKAAHAMIRFILTAPPTTDFQPHYPRFLRALYDIAFPTDLTESYSNRRISVRRSASRSPGGPHAPV